jgi:hypothetical protein
MLSCQSFPVASRSAKRFKKLFGRGPAATESGWLFLFHQATFPFSVGCTSLILKSPRLGFGLIESCRCTVREWNVWSAGDGYRLRSPIC